MEVAEAFVKMGTRDAQAPIEAGLAKETMISLMYRHADLLAATAKSTESDILKEIAMHLSGYDIKALYEKSGIEDLRALGGNLMTAGRLNLAVKIFEFIHSNGLGDTDDHIDLASIQYGLGHKLEAKGMLRSYFRENPIKFDPSIHERRKAAATIIKFSGFDKTQYKISPDKDSGYKRYRSGGHFMLKHLLNDSDFDVYSYTVCDGNIFEIPPEEPSDLMLNTIADADTEHASLVALGEFLKDKTDVNVINHPEQVLNTSRDKNYRRLNEIPGIRFPKTARFNTEKTTPAEMTDHIEASGFNYPFIIRETGTHTAVSTELLHNRQQLTSYLSNVRGDSVYAIEFVANASPEGHYTKMRFFSIDGKLYPVVHHVDEVWNVHGGNRKTFMASHDWMVEKEKQFLSDPASVLGDHIYKRLEELPEIIGLDFFGFDFTLLDAETILIFELNPAMRHSFTHAENFPYMRPYLENISRAFQTMIERRAGCR